MNTLTPARYLAQQATQFADSIEDVRDDASTPIEKRAYPLDMTGRGDVKAVHETPQRNWG